MFSPVAQSIFDGFIQDFLLPKLDELYTQSITPIAQKALCLVLYSVITLKPTQFRELLADYYQLPKFDVVRLLVLEYNRIAFLLDVDGYPPLVAVTDPRLYSAPLPEHSVLVDLFSKGFKDSIMSWLEGHFPVHLSKAVDDIKNRFETVFSS